MTTRLVVVGAGGFGRETLDVIEAVNRAADTAAYEVVGVLDDAPSELNLARLASRGFEYLGSVADWLSGGDDADFVIGVGAPGPRSKLAEKFGSAGLEATTLVHPQAVVGSVGSLKPGTIICSGVQLSTNVHIGLHGHVNASANIGHDSVLGDFVSVNPAATISGECTIDSGVLVGAGSVILQGLTVGANAVVGAAACVVRDVEAGATVKGVPAR